MSTSFICITNTYQASRNASGNTNLRDRSRRRPIRIV